MYLPRRFAETDLTELDALIGRDAFVTLVTQDADGAPFVSHLPVLYHRDGDRVRFSGHWARPNPQSKHGGPALLIVHGPHAYLSPTWYVEPDKNVPTWNYAVAHIRGSLSSFDDTDRMRDLVAELAAKYEAMVGSDWRFPESAPGELADLGGIIGFELVAERIDLKFKLNQNHPADNVIGAANALHQQGGQAAEIAALMRQRLAQRTAAPTAE